MRSGGAVRRYERRFEEKHWLKRGEVEGGMSQMVPVRRLWGWRMGVTVE